MKIYIIGLVYLFLNTISAYALEVNGIVTAEGRLFLDSPAYAEQERNSASIALEGEIYQELQENFSFRAEPFFRVDSSDSKRTHWDLRTCHLLYFDNHWQIVAGIDKVFWGSTEFVHLVDIINQTDTLESVDSEEKLGQPMVHFTVEHDWGVIDGFVLPYFRERVYPGEEGRLRGPIVIDGSSAVYESGAAETHLDVALRYSHTFDNIDLGLYHFIGTSREPVFLQTDATTLAPFYQQINQTGLDFQLVEGQWLWKMEGLYRTGQGKGRAATTFGFEYTWTGPFAMPMDIGIVGEYVHDERQIADMFPYDNDVMIGMRWSLHDTASTELLFGVVKDVQNESLFFTLEASRRFGDSFRLEINGLLFGSVDENDPLTHYKEDSFVRVEAKFFF